MTKYLLINSFIPFILLFKLRELKNVDWFWLCWYSTAEKPIRFWKRSCLVLKKVDPGVLSAPGKVVLLPRPSLHLPGWQEPLQTRRRRLRERSAVGGWEIYQGDRKAKEDIERRRAQGGMGVDRRRGRGTRVTKWWTNDENRRLCIFKSPSGGNLSEFWLCPHICMT